MANVFFKKQKRQSLQEQLQIILCQIKQNWVQPDNKKNTQKKLWKHLSFFSQDFQKYIQLKKNNIFPKNFLKKCYEVDIPDKDQKDGIANSDLHLYIVYYKEKNGELADAVFCAVADQGITRPTFGRVNFNIQKMDIIEGDMKTFQNDLETTIHEIMHIIGFSTHIMQYWIDPETNKPYKESFQQKLLKEKTYQGKQSFILTSKNVIEVTRKYYNCPKAEGMYLENQGVIGKIGSHWKRTLIYNELMTESSILVKSSISIFTIALLKDTGFYAEVNGNMAGQIFWGKGKGCEFLENVCQSKTEYPEFPQKVDDFQCSFEYEGFAYSETNKYADNCRMEQPEIEDLCTNPNAIDDEEDLEMEEDKLSDYSTQSKCFQSTAVQASSKYEYDISVRCHKFKCSSDASEISVIFPDIQLQVLCGIGEQGKQKDIDKSGKKAKGQITCPQDYNRFCNNSRICPNFCSQKGVCVNGQCICQSGYGGENCITKCSGVVNDGKCIQQGFCPSGKFKNPDNTCKSDCPQGLYGKNGNCEPCHSSCSRCTGPLPNQCSKCQFLTLLQDNQCVDKCNEKQGYKLNQAQGICESQISTICQGNCKTCEKKILLYVSLANKDIQNKLIIRAKIHVLWDLSQLKILNNVQNLQLDVFNKKILILVLHVILLKDIDQVQINNLQFARKIVHNVILRIHLSVLFAKDLNLKLIIVVVQINALVIVFILRVLENANNVLKIVKIVMIMVAKNVKMVSIQIQKLKLVLNVFLNKLIVKIVMIPSVYNVMIFKKKNANFCLRWKFRKWKYCNQWNQYNKMPDRVQIMQLIQRMLIMQLRFYYGKQNKKMYYMYLKIRQMYSMYGNKMHYLFF
ncbi:leishmanolysin family protein, putative [Ichthyophthirius multifiliis]|uniref:Leishmanolysin family protein, putative n=1 Tax=Ichthyophthirius multifiliis TaxID=5932 RepID=G0R594_ICHMU|nr:leishmanolysin family protein, putative [Ichthyophthirius multifiliis]EGR27371.1 leishmanolysin family protein, putative [Ichthyophthirius multifiliis]|eukprot:XP_004024255.1 leishmanolysin family protein, putative [Ichthyophthirius multifiliis]